MGTVRSVGEPLTEDQKRKICAEVYQENHGATIDTESIISGLDIAANLLTPELVAQEKSNPAYVSR
jgi:hypothetical protein